MNTQKVSYRGAISVSFMSMFFLGGGNMLLSATKESLMEHFGVGLVEIGLLFTIRSLVCGIIPIACGKLSDKFGRKAMILIGGGMFVLYYILVPATGRFAALYGIVFIYSIAYSFVDPSGMSILFDALENPAPALPFIQVFYAIGSVAAPLMVSFLLRGQLPWGMAYFIYGGMALFMCIYAAFMRFPPVASHAASGKERDYFGFVRQPKLMREGLTLFLFSFASAAVASTIVNWADIYVRDVYGYSTTQAVQVLSFVPVGGVLGTLFMSQVARRMAAPHILRLWPSITLASLLLSLFMPFGSLFVVFIMLTSFTAGCMFSVVVGYMGMLFYKNAGASTGAISSASAAGTALCSFITGRLVGILGVRAVFFIIAGFGCVTVLLGMLVHRHHQHLLKE